MGMELWRLQYINVMSEGTPIFKAGVAVAAPTDWGFYDSVYTERFMRTPKKTWKVTMLHLLLTVPTN